MSEVWHFECASCGEAMSDPYDREHPFQDNEGALVCPGCGKKYEHGIVEVKEKMRQMPETGKLYGLIPLYTPGGVLPDQPNKFLVGWMVEEFEGVLGDV